MPVIRRRRAILHIGTAKTGSTTIQALLAGSRDQLLAQGFAYPASLGRRNHLHLGVFAADDSQAARHARILGETGSVDAIRQSIAARLEAEIEALPQAVHSLVFSSESLADNVSSADGLRRLKTLLDAWCDDYRVLVYLRRQDEFAVSLYSTLLRGGSTQAEMLPPPEADPRFDWAALLDRWSAVFGQGALMPRLFDPAVFVDGDLLADLRAALGLGPLPMPEAAQPLNPSLTPPAQEFLRRLNRAARGDLAGSPGDAEEDEVGKAPAFIRHLLNARFAGRGRMPARAAASAFVARHAVGNERVRATFFASRPSLFSTDFSRYPLEAEALPSGEAVAEVGIAVALAQAAELAATQADIAARRGRERMADAPEDARRQFRRALGRRAGHLGALRGLLDLATDAEQRGEVAQRLAQALAAEPDRQELRQLLHRLDPAPQAADPAAPQTPAGEVAADPRRTPEARATRRARRADALAASGGTAPDAAAAEPSGHEDAAGAARRERRAERLRRRGAAAGHG